MNSMHGSRRMRRGSSSVGRLGSILFLVSIMAPLAEAGENPITDAAASLDSGQLRLQFAAREGVQGNGRSVSVDFGSGISWRHTRDDRRGDWCDVCDLEVTLSYRQGEVRRLRWRIEGSQERHRDDLLDLGRVDAVAARDFLLGIVDQSEDRVAVEALEAAVLSEAAVPWRQLLALARDGNRSRSLRSKALFWLGQEAQEAVTAELEGVVADELEDLEVRKAAVFALSQRPARESIPSLKRIALEHRNLALRRDALFWLAQNDDPEVIDFFEAILSDTEEN